MTVFMPAPCHASARNDAPGGAKHPLVTEPAAPAELLPAATVVVVRDGPEGLEVLLLERSNVGAFAGMWVFPGGRVDATDAGDDEFGRARSAAVREAQEEVGLVVPPDALAPWAHWTPPAYQPRRFSTWFFAAPWEGDGVVIDGHEIVAHSWISPADAIARRLPMAPPTFVTLHQMAGRRTLAELAAGPEHGVERFVTRMASDRSCVLWHGDAGYDASDADAPGLRHRALLRDGVMLEYVRTAPSHVGG
jgi:8-oxo-dGTP pyrophosphatase MutT (NUDIX family)